MIQPNIGWDSIDRWVINDGCQFLVFPFSPCRLFGIDMRRFGKGEEKSITILRNPLWNSRKAFQRMWNGRCNDNRARISHCSENYASTRLLSLKICEKRFQFESIFSNEWFFFSYRLVPFRSPMHIRAFFFCCNKTAKSTKFPPCHLKRILVSLFCANRLCDTIRFGIQNEIIRWMSMATCSCSL